MAYNEKLADMIRNVLGDVPKMAEKKMFGGVAFMVNDKMCVGVHKEDLIVRCDPQMNDDLLTKKGVRQFDITGKPMIGWLLIKSDSITKQKDFEYWIKLALDSNKKIKPSKKK